MLLVLAACAVSPVPEAPLSIAASQQWEERKASLSALQQWKISGRIAVSDARDSWRSTVHWQLYPDSYDIRFLTISGQQTVRLAVDETGATLYLPDEEVAASDVDGLLRERLGWNVPLDSLRYWIIGLPVPGMVSKYKLDETGHLKWLEQAGWQIDYKRYDSEYGLELPKKIMLQYKRATIRLVIDGWDLGPRPENKTGHVSMGVPEG